MLPVIEHGGGQVVTRAEVDTILIEAGRAVGVRLADGTELRARTIVSAAGVPITYGCLLRRPSLPHTGSMASRPVTVRRSRMCASTLA